MISKAEEAAREYALRLLGKRPYSRRELTDKLTGRGFTSECAEETVERLAEAGLQNDADYAETVVRHYSRKGFGERRIRDELWRRGIGRELWDGALQEAGTDENTLGALIKARLRGGRPDEGEARRVTGWLLRRGYSWDEVRGAMRRYISDFEDMD